MKTKSEDTIKPPAAGADTLPVDIAVEPYIGKDEVARRMGRTVRGVESLMIRGVIPYYQFDSRASFRWSEIQQRIAETCRVCKGCPSRQDAKES